MRALDVTCAVVLSTNVPVSHAFRATHFHTCSTSIYSHNTAN